MLGRRDALRATCLVAVSMLPAGCTRVVSEFTDDSTDDGGPPDFGPYDPTGGSTSSTSTSTTTTSTTSTTSTTTTTDDPPPDLPPDESCDLPSGDTDCGVDQKCVPLWAWSYACVPVLGDKQPGEPCSLDDASNTDDCGPDSYCFLGRCQTFCDTQAACTGDRHCIVDTFDGPNWLCIDQCDPILQDCPAPDGCSWTNFIYGFQCVVVAGRGLGESCDFFGDFLCAPGLDCIDTLSYPGGCPSQSQSCCTSYCDTELGDQACSGGPPNSSCVGLGTELAPTVGLCSGDGSSMLTPGQIQIVEVYADPPGVAINEAPLEYVELVNLGDTQVELGPLRLSDLISSQEPLIQERFTAGGDGGCNGGGPTCLAPGRRALLVASTYAGADGGALLLRSNNTIVNGLLQPFTRLQLTGPGDEVVSSYRQWPDPMGEPLPVDELPLHRVDEAGPDTPDNWIVAPPSPGQ